MTRHLDEARWPPAGRAELALRFACGCVAGVVLAFGLVVVGVPGKLAAHPWTAVLFGAAVCGVLAVWQWDRFWRWWLRLAASLP